MTEYTVVGVRPAQEGQGVQPEEILERFEGRTFTLHELEQRGVRFAGAKAVYTVLGADWYLDVWPLPAEDTPARPEPAAS